MVLGALLWTALSPLGLLVAGIIDLVRRRRLATLRLWAFVGAYFWGEVLGLLGLGFAFIASGFGLSPSRLEANAYAAQDAWVGALWRITCRLYDLKLELELPPKLKKGPFIVLVRHTSLLDTMIPTMYLARRYGLRLRYVLKRELVWDPCLDVGGHWMPNHWVDRSGTSRKRELSALRALCSNLDPHMGVLLYPEGTRFSNVRRKEALARLASRDKELHGLAMRCHHTLPPRPSGTLAVLNGAANADILVCKHAGLLGLGSFKDLWDGTLVGQKIHVRVDRISRKDVPREPEKMVRWLFDTWASVDAWVSTREESPHRRRPPTSSLPTIERRHSSAITLRD